ncbi:MAG: hypothetical protein K9G37_11465, partial [Crocinitomicaceae bacterium]|nr:hypothetical protein [Crocinitomicaceae bacterium]
MRGLILFFMLTLSSISFSQSYPTNREAFVKAFQKSLSEYGKGEFHDFAKKDFPLMLLETSDFPEAFFTKMVETCNLMETKKLKPYPEIYNYVFSVYALAKGK